MTTVVEIRGKRENEASDISKADEQINEVIHAKRKLNEKASPLLRLPGELRNKVYGFLIDKREIIFTLKYSNMRIPSRNWRALTQISRDLREELHSYVLDHGTLYFHHQELNSVHFNFLRKKILRIESLALDITNEPYDGDTAALIARKLTPLCKEGRLRRIIIKGVYGVWEFEAWSDSSAYCTQTRNLVKDLSHMMNVETIGHDVTVEKGKEMSTERMMRQNYERAMCRDFAEQLDAYEILFKDDSEESYDEDDMSIDEDEMSVDEHEMSVDEDEIYYDDEIPSEQES